MSDEGRGGRQGAEPEIKVVDRRRFRAQEGEPETAAEPPHEGEIIPEPVDERDARVAEQAARIDELTRAYAALLEDSKAFRGRLERERARVVEAERASVAQALLEAADDLERALSAAESAGSDRGRAIGPLVEGVRLSLSRIQKRIADLGAERLSILGQRFDPHVAEAVDAMSVSDPERDGMVVEEVRAGYRIGDRVLRPARVRVGRLARA